MRMNSKEEKLFNQALKEFDILNNSYFWESVDGLDRPDLVYESFKYGFEAAIKLLKDNNERFGD